MRFQPKALANLPEGAVGIWSVEFRKIPKVVVIVVAYLSAFHRTASDTDYWMMRTLFIAIKTCAWRSPHLLESFQCSCGFLRIRPLNLLFVQSHQAEIIIANRLIHWRSNVTRVWVEPKSCGQGLRKNDAFTVLATLPKVYSNNVIYSYIRWVSCFIQR